MKREEKSILEMVQGGVMERVDLETQRILANIADLNTSATAKRSLILQIDFFPDVQRKTLSLKFVSKSKLEPLGAIATTLCGIADPGGEMRWLEATPQSPGQLSLDGKEQEPPALLRVIS
jgi:hypothetical protein